MSTDPVLMNPPSHQALAEEIRAHSPAMQLYRNHSEWFGMEIHGKRYWIPPDLGGKPAQHPETREVVAGDGTLRVRDVYGRLQDKMSQKFTGGYGPLEGQGMSAIVMYALHTYREAGVVWLPGDGTDEARKRASGAMVRNHLKAQAQYTVEAHQAVVDNWRKANPGKPVPHSLITNAVRKAQRYLDNLALEGRQGFDFVCEHGCSDFDNFEDYQRHMKVQHQKDVKFGERPGVSPEPARGLEGTPAPSEPLPMAPPLACPSCDQHHEPGPCLPVAPSTPPKDTTGGIEGAARRKKTN